MADFDRESMLEMFNYEMSQLIDQMEQIIVQCDTGYSTSDINEIFRIMHTIKGSAAMMMFDSIANTAHAMEDLFYFLREENPRDLDFSVLTDLVLEGMDFVKGELNKVESGSIPDGDGSVVIRKLKEHLRMIKNVSSGAAQAGNTAGKEQMSGAYENNGMGQGKQATSGASQNKPPSPTAPPAPRGLHHYKVKINFTDGCEMENIRAYTLVHNLGDSITNVSHVPDDVIDESAIAIIRKNGFLLNFSSFQEYKSIYEQLSKTVYLQDLKMEEISDVATPQLQASISGKLRHYTAVVHFEDGAEMENVRSYTMVHNIEKSFDRLVYTPEDLIDEAATEVIRRDGFKLDIWTDKDYNEVNEILSSTIYLKDLNLLEIDGSAKQEEVKTVTETMPVEVKEARAPEAVKPAEVVHEAAPSGSDPQSSKKMPVQHVISVSVGKLDQLLNLMGELVIAEAMVTQNPDLEGLELESFHKETRQLRKIINDVQDNVMSMRMVPLSTTFFKMHRIVRDMCKALGKEVQLEIAGEETEVDKNIIEHISDPIMHIIRNSIDHGIEMPDKRRRAGKREQGTVLLEAKNAGGDVLISVKDDGGGLNKEAIMQRAKNNGLLRKAENEYTDKEIHQFIFLPGFSTNDTVTSYSGRGVGMDVVTNNLEMVGGSVLVDSTLGEGSTFTLKIPLTLAIIEGMTIKMGGAKYTIPIVSIKQSLKAKKEHLFKDPSGNEMITVRGEVYNVVRLYEFFNANTDITDIEDGIIIMLEGGERTICLFADELIGEQQVVVKTMPKYIKKIRGISGCTLLGNGDISLIIDVAGFFD